MQGRCWFGGTQGQRLWRVPLPLLNKEEEDVWVGGGRAEGREGGRQSQLQRTKSNGRELRQEEFFFKDTRNERKQEAPRGLRVRELKFKMEIYQSSN